jgi:hypothetical protein
MGGNLMRDDELDCILGKKEEIVPSSGFRASVMNAVQRQTAALPPIPFPWKRALPGSLALALALVMVTALSIMPWNGGAEAPLPADLLTIFASTINVWKNVGASWILFALVLSFAFVNLSMRIVSRRTQ